MVKNFTVKALWDEEANVFYSESDIIGLHIEAKNIEEFEQIMEDCARDLIIANHLNGSDIASKPIRDYLPAIIWQRPDKAMAPA